MIVYARLVIRMCRPTRRQVTDVNVVTIDTRPTIPLWIWIVGPVIGLVVVWIVIGLWHAFVWPLAKITALAICPFQVWSILGESGVE